MPELGAHPNRLFTREAKMAIPQSASEVSKRKHELLGNTEPICPYCAKALDKMPSRKKKCPKCGNSICVRTRPADRKRVVVTEQDAGRIEEQWAVEHDTPEAHGTNQMEFDKQRAEVAAKWGRTPSDRDVYWSLYNKHLLEHAKQHDWGLYCNTRLHMAELLRHEKDYRLALDTYLEVSYLDANGPSNMGGILDPEIIREVPPFSRDMAFQAPAVVYQIQELCESLGMDERDLKRAFIQVASNLHKNMKLPVSPEQGWKDIKEELAKRA